MSVSWQQYGGGEPRTLSLPGHGELQFLLYQPGAEAGETVLAGGAPLLLFLHGAGERGSDLARVTRHGPQRYLAGRPDSPFFIVAPQCPEGRSWQLPALRTLLDTLQASLPVDPTRVYLTGLSMGGYATWRWAGIEPGRFAAIVPICGGGDPADAARMRELPVWAFHGAQDGIVPVQQSLEMVEALLAAGGSPKLTVDPDAGHDSWTRAYDDPALYAWLLRHRLDGEGGWRHEG